jgi:hypothetical protein
VTGGKRLATGLIEDRNRVGWPLFGANGAGTLDYRPTGKAKCEGDDLPTRALGAEATDLGILPSVQTVFLGIRGSCHEQ